MINNPPVFVKRIYGNNDINTPKDIIVTTDSFYILSYYSLYRLNSTDFSFKWAKYFSQEQSAFAVFPTEDYLYLSGNISSFKLNALDGTAVNT